LKRTTVVFGATGLTGSNLTEELARSEAYDKILIFTRRKSNAGAETAVQSASSSKIREIEFDITNIEAVKDEIKGEDLFCCLGTTIKKAGSQEAFKKVDLEAPAKIASIAAANGVKQFIVISSIGADPGSRNFYLKTKGQMEQAVQKEHFQAVAILRPSMITGKRKEFRLAEEAGKIMFKPLEKLLVGRLRKYRSIKAKTIAEAMVKIALTPQDKIVFESHEIHILAGLTGN